ncbi:MAG: transcription antitermination factor NusB [Candidatus Electrothrix sp. Rat3]|jgi:N utilization substance protein B|nr:transcription antitermination factor NusB [Candidatus Electrothrix rattekaaiensis]
MGLRRKSRELALQFFYGYELQKCPAAEGGILHNEIENEVEIFYTCFKSDQKAHPYAEQLINGVCAHQQEIDNALADCSHHWRVERMALVDRNILRIATYEMLYIKDIPVTVAINEALEIAKRYAEPESISFINGILDNLQGRKAG